MPPFQPTTKQQMEIDELLKNIPPRPFPTYECLTYDDFLANHLIPNAPFLLSLKNTAEWQACRDFRFPPSPSSLHSLPNLHALRKYGNQMVPVANTHKRHFSEFERTERTLGEVIDIWEGENQDIGRGLYVKDWHLFAEIEAEGRGVKEVYDVPECFRGKPVHDWLNPPYNPEPTSATFSKMNTNTSDFRFAYLGPPMTYTPLHQDVYGSYSWSANVVGKKIWWIFPPGRLDRARDKEGNLVFDVRTIPDEGGGIKVLQEEGEIMFIPSGWHHQVLNISFCFSINHNFFSSPTLPRIYQNLLERQAEIEESISDVREMIIERLGVQGQWEEEWIEEVQKLLKMDAGWDWRDFWSTILSNMERPPAPAQLVAPPKMRNAWILKTMEKYKKQKEWVMCKNVRVIIQQIEIRLSDVLAETDPYS
nr:hypothetical protein L203_04370 [Cryptococcus depauperatus CBS 7841]